MPNIHRVSLIVHGGAFIRAPLEVVWAVHTDMNFWQGWRRGLRGPGRSHLAGRFAVGSSFRSHASGFSLRATPSLVEPPRRVLLQLASLGLRGLQSWTLEPHEDGVRVRTSLALDGWRVGRLLRDWRRRSCERAIAEWLATLKTRAELLPRIGRAAALLNSRGWR